jgi:DNA-binding NarL/FixJ family response regulator
MGAKPVKYRFCPMRQIWDPGAPMEFRPRILLADDHAGILKNASILLESDFDVVGAVSDGRAAVDAVFKLRPDLVVLDIMMPEMDGLRAAKEMRRRGSEAKVIFLSVQEDEEYVAAALESGGLAYVLKSRMYPDLVEAIGQVLAGGMFVSSRVI